MEQTRDSGLGFRNTMVAARTLKGERLRTRGLLV